MFLLMISVFLAGILMIALEDWVVINKTATALLMSVVLWMIVAFSGTVPSINPFFVEHLGDVSETLFFVLGAMVIVELVDTYGGFRIVLNALRTTDKRKFLWIISFLTFFISALLDNLATGIVMITLLRKVIPHRVERKIFACMIIIAANAGGSWSPIGDVTTILLWTGGNITPLHQMSHLILPALAAMVVPLLLITRFYPKGAHWNQRGEHDKEVPPVVTKRSSIVILTMGVGTMIMVPFFSEYTTLPPFMLILTGIAVMWIYSDFTYWGKTELGDDQKVTVTRILTRLDMPTILFFLGILMSVAALDTSGQLQAASEFISSRIGSELTIGFIVGVISSFVDNVALVAATQGMYPIDPASAAYMVNGEFWTFLAYCAVNGGSLLIIGSATGVTVMGMEKISFGYYLKRFSLIALAGYVAGAGVYLLLF